MFMSVQRKLGVFSNELCYCKDTDQTYLTLVPILIETAGHFECANHLVISVLYLPALFWAQSRSKMFA